MKKSVNYFLLFQEAEVYRSSFNERWYYAGSYAYVRCALKPLNHDWIAGYGGVAASFGRILFLTSITVISFSVS